MALEIERKFLVNVSALPTGVAGQKIIQGYFDSGNKNSIRIRIISEKAFLTIKGPDRSGVRPEFEYPIPLEDAEFMLHNFCTGRIIEKIRRVVIFGGKSWEIDEFLGLNSGLWIAEVELTAPDEEINVPLWATREVTGIKQYYNTFLAEHPFTSWNEKLNY